MEGVEPAEIVDSCCLLEFFPGLSALVEEVGAEPDLLQVGLVRVLTQDLLHGDSSAGAAVHGQPDQTEASPPQQSYPLEFIWETLTELAVLFVGQQRSDVTSAAFLLLVDALG